MSMNSSLHTSDMTNKHPLEVKFKNWPARSYSCSSYITLEFGQVNEGEMTLFARHSMYGDLIAGLEDAARQLREVVAKEMVQTWGFPIRTAVSSSICPLCDKPSLHGEVHRECADHEQWLADAAAESRVP